MTAVVEREVTVLDAVKSETQKLVQETQSPPQDIKFEPQAWTREGRTD